MEANKDEIRAEEICAQLTLDEKVSLLSGKDFWSTKPIERLGVPSVIMTDGPHGLRKEVASAGTNIMKGSEISVCFPPAATSASSWDPTLLTAMGEAIAEEAWQQGMTTVLGPGVNIKRSPLCGRNFEYFSEDPFLAGKMGTAWVNGVQSKGIGVSLKHFCANNQEHIRMSINAQVDERALREIYLSAFEAVVKNAHPSTIMGSYNRLNGTYLCENKRLLTDILRSEWGYQGIVVSDWGAVNDRIKGVPAGLDLEMPGNNGMNDRLVAEAVKNGTLAEADVDVLVKRMIKFALNCKRNEHQGYKADMEKHHQIARNIAANSAVLLKNDGILPLDKTEKIAVIGKLADKMRYQGSGSSRINPYRTVSFKQYLENENIPFDYADGYTLKGDGFSSKLLKQAVETAKSADKVVVFVGLTDVYESEGFDRKNLLMPEGHRLLVEQLQKVNQNIVIVLSGGSPTKLPWVKDVKAILNVYLGGEAGGEACGDVLFGKVNPSGKLAETFPLRNHDNIVSRYFPMGPRSVQHRESVYVGYRFFDAAEKNVAFPFGFGLSYTSFEYSDLKLSADKIKEGEPLSATFTVKNVGKVDGAEVAQLYVADKESTIYRPVKELKGFQKVFLKAGESKEITLELDARSFAYYNVLIHDWHVESGDFDILVGASSRDIRLSATVNVTSANPDAPIPDYRATAPYYYNTSEKAEVKKRIPHEDFQAVYGAPLEENTPFQKGEFTINNTVSQVAVTGFGKFLYGVLRFGAKIVAGGSENSAMVTESIKDMPIRSFSGFTGGLIPMESSFGLVDVFNGTKGGFKRFIRGFKAESKRKKAAKKAAKAAAAK